MRTFPGLPSLRLFAAEARRSVILFLRYPLEAITGVVTLTAIFFALFIGVRYIAGPGAQFGNRLDSVIVSYLLWSLTIFALGDMGWTIQFDAMMGTLEQVMLSPFGPVRVFLSRALADLSMQLLTIAVVFTIIKYTTRQHLTFTLGVFPPLFTVVFGTYGLGFMLAGLTLLFKRIQNVLQLSQFFVLFLIAVPVETFQGLWGALGYLIPLASGAGMVRELMTRDVAFSPVVFLLALLNGLAYFFLGIAFFLLANRAARRRGLIGGY